MACCTSRLGSWLSVGEKLSQMADEFDNTSSSKNKTHVVDWTFDEYSLEVCLLKELQPSQASLKRPQAPLREVAQHICALLRDQWTDLVAQSNASPLHTHTVHREKTGLPWTIRVYSRATKARAPKILISLGTLAAGTQKIVKLFIASSGKTFKPCIFLTPIRNNSIAAISLDQEASLLKTLAQAQTPNIPKYKTLTYYGKNEAIRIAFVMKKYTCDLIQYAPRLHSLGGQFLRQEIARIICSVTQTLHHIHSASYCHLDIKLDNILIDIPNKKSLLGDFGLSARVGERISLRGSAGYIPPEFFIRMIKGRNTIVAQPGHDMWSLGAVILSLCLNETIFFDIQKQIFQQKNDIDRDCRIYEFIDKTKLFRQYLKTSKDPLFLTIAKLLSRTIQKRPSPAQVFLTLQKTASLPTLFPTLFPEPLLQKAQTTYL